jgi:hypothetical protein
MENGNPLTEGSTNPLETLEERKPKKRDKSE